MHKKIYLVLAIAAIFSAFIFVSSVSCFAQGQEQGQGQGQGQGQAQGQEQGRGGGPTWMNAENMPKAFIEAEDKDGDGKVSKDEFGGPDTMFTSMDKNEDGFIELSEGPTAETLQGLMGGGRSGGEGGAQGGAPQGGAPGGQGGNAPAGN